MPAGAADGAVAPPCAVEGGRIRITGAGFPVDPPPAVTIGGVDARVVFASPRRLAVIVPAGLDGGPAVVRVGGAGHPESGARTVLVGEPWATGLHQVDNPLFDASGHLYVTYSGSRGQEAPVSVFRVTPEGTREPFLTGIVNATSLAFDPAGRLHVSSRFDGAVYRVASDGTYEPVASDLGIACGLAFDAEGTMFVGDRSGTIFRVREGRAEAFATLPPSVAAFHLAFGPDGELFVSGPTLGAYDHVYRIARDGRVRSLAASFGRPQGLAFSPEGVLHVVDAMAGSSGLYRLPDVDGPPELLVAGYALVGVAFGPGGQLAVCSNDTVYRFP